jgi:thiamine kinase-like enzyme
VWRIDTNSEIYILKEAKGDERYIYAAISGVCKNSVPKIYQTVTDDEKTYLLMEYIEGEDLCRCDRKKLTLALDSLIALQRETWEMQRIDGLENSFEKSLDSRKNRGEYLNDTLLEEAYEKFLTVYRSTPKTLCHDDLLPFNIIVGEQNAHLIDWEIGGMLPYPTPFARLIAHTKEDENSLFYMTEADKRFAIDYYYDKLLKEKGVLYQDWLHTLEYFLFYEYCEWVFVGNKYQATDGEYYKKYLPIAKKQAAEILNTQQN